MTEHRTARLKRAVKRIANLPLSPYAVDLDFTKTRKDR